MKKIKNIKIEHIFLIYIVLQPFLDIYTNYNKHPVQILGIAFNVLINFVLIFVMFSYYLRLIIKNKDAKMDVIRGGVYISIFFVYSILHYWNMQNFDDTVFKRESFGYLKETYFMFRCFVLPVLLLYILYRLNIKKSTIIRAIKLSVFIICFIIVGTNIFGVSLASYAEHGKLIYIDGSIFHWPFFVGSDNFDLYTSKGWFHSANELSAILIAFSPFVIYSFLEDTDKLKFEKIFDIILMVLLVLTMNMLGTRTASFGMIAILICIFIIYMYFVFVKKNSFDFKKLAFKFLLLVLLFGVLFFMSPFYNNRYGKFKKEFEERPLKEEDKQTEEIYKAGFAEYMETHYWYFYIEHQLLDIYPVDNDKAFWKYIINRDLRLNSNYRIIKTDLYNRILERNNNKFDYVLGIGHNDILTNEKDYSIQMYQYGVFGILVLIGPFIICILYCLYTIIKNRVILIKPEIVFVLMGNVIGIIVPYLTGHVFGLVFPTTYIVLNTLLLLTLVKLNLEKKV